MEQVLYAAFQAKHVKGGRSPKLPVGVQLLMILKYWRQYVTQIPGKKTLLKANEIEVVLVNITESPIERPKNGIQEKRSTTQVIVNQRTGKIISFDHRKGSVHDFKLYKSTVGYAISGGILARFDSGYQSVLNFHKNSEIPKKKSKKLPLTKRREMRVARKDYPVRERTFNGLLVIDEKKKR